jgi:hypothetical protein
MIDFNNKGFFKLKQNNEYADRVTALLLDGEQVIDATNPCATAWCSPTSASSR